MSRFLPTGAPIPSNPDAQFAAWRRGIEERLARLERNRTALEIPAEISGGLLTSGYITTGVDSSTFQNAYTFHTPRPYYDAIEVVCVVAVPGGNTGEIRLRDATTGAVTSARSITGTVRVRFRWLHGADITPATAARWTGVVQVRRVSGAGVLQVFKPETAFFSPSTYLEDAATDGASVLL